MYSQKNPIKSAENIKIFNFADGSKTSQVQVSQKIDKQGDNQAAARTDVNPGLLVLPFFVLALSGVVAYYKFKKARQIPCKNCRFFDNNNYLKCAVDPINVLTEEARNCQDYHPQNKKFSWLSQISRKKRN